MGEVSALTTALDQLRSAAARDGRGLLLGVPQDGGGVLITSLAHCQPAELRAAEDKLAGMLPLPVRVVGAFHPVGAAVDARPGWVVATPGADGAPALSRAGGGGCAPPRAVDLPPGGLLELLGLAPLRVVAELVVEWEAGGGGKAAAAAAAAAVDAAAQQLTGPAAVLCVQAADGALATPAADAAVPDGAATVLRPLVRLSPATPVAVPAAPRATLAARAARVDAARLRLDALCYARAGAPLAAAAANRALPALAAQLRAARAALAAAAAAGAPPAPLRAAHFSPPGLPHHVTMLYALDDPASDAAEAAARPARAAAHALLGLPPDRPLLRLACAAGGLGAGRGGGPAPARGAAPGDGRLWDVHAGLPPSGVKGGRLAMVQGAVAYCHYGQGGLDDAGWGCAYRSLQTVVSWFCAAGYASRPLPSHREVQAALAALGDKPPSFVGSREWIGAVEVGYALDALLGVQSRVLTVAAGRDVGARARELAAHFDLHGTPVMVGGGVLAYTLVGVDFCEATGECAFLVLDPHYGGPDEPARVRAGGWAAWKRPGDRAAAGGDLFVPDAFYNLLCPLRPAEV